MTKSHPSPQPSIRAKRVCPWIVRAKFNAAQFVEHAARNELQVRGPRSWLTPPGQNQVPGTATEKLEYMTPQGQRLAIAIQYRRPDGTLGSSDRPEPKWLVEGSEILTPSHRDDESRPDCPAWRPRALAAT